MSQSILIHPPPPGKPGKTFLSERIQATRVTFLSNSSPRGKNDGRIPEGWAKFSLREETAP